MPRLNYTMATGYKWSKSFGSGHCFHLLLLTCMINSRFRFLLHDVYAHNSLVCESNICHIILVKDTLHTIIVNVPLDVCSTFSCIYVHTSTHSLTHTSKITYSNISVPICSVWNTYSQVHNFKQSKPTKPHIFHSCIFKYGFFFSILSTHVETVHKLRIFIWIMIDRHFPLY